MEPEKTSFRQFEYCKLCKISHKKRKKHIYSKSHQTILKNILKKFKLKIHSVKKDMFAPQVCGPEFESGAKFWCYFCAEELDKHTRVELTTIVGGGLLEHVASEHHKEKFVEFLYQNLVADVKQLQPDYTLPPEDLTIFKNASFHAVKRYQKTEDLQRRKVAGDITRTDIQRRMFQQSEAMKSDIRPVATPPSQLPGNSGNQDEKIPGKRTVSAFAIGLSVVQPHDVAVGNMYTGAIPPWLQPDDRLTTGEIGPSLHDYQEHLEQQRKAKLPANRVGAQCDLSSDPSHTWLPSFGRVWSKGRRVQSKLHFEKQMSWNKNLTKRTSESSDAGTSTGGQTVISAGSDTTRVQGLHGSNTRVNLKKAAPHTQGAHIDLTHMPAPAIATHTKPYKRKRTNISQLCNNGFDWSGAPVEASSSNHIVPYKQKCDKATVSRTGITNLIQTPVLALPDKHAH